MSISNQLKTQIRRSGLSMLQLAKNSGVSQPVLSRFIANPPAQHRDIRLEGTADKLAKYFELELVPSKRSPRPKKRAEISR